MGFLSNLFGGGPRPDPALAVSARQLAQASVLSEEISKLIRSTLFDEELIPTGKTPAALAADPYIAGLVFGMARENAKSMGVGIDDRAAFVVGGGVTRILFGHMTPSTDPEAPVRFELGNSNGKKLAQFMIGSDSPAPGGPDPLQDWWIDYVLYKYASDGFRETDEYQDIVPQPWF